jgi:hypothetical protein|tara:strand:+ start:1064 stop:1504 length:441 start_codon:yes stop_codon:yes gene_type:complete
MNKKYLLISALVFSFGLHAEKIQSIENYLTLHASDNQEAVSSYLSKRCAATFLVVAKIFNNENKPDDKKVSDTMTKAAVKMIETASYIDASVAKRDVLDVAVDVNAEVKRIFNILWEVSEDSYARTAVYLSPHVDDLKVCQTIAQS